MRTDEEILFYSKEIKIALPRSAFELSFGLTKLQTLFYVMKV